MPRLGGIEAGGTKFVCAIGSDPGDLESIECPTTTPEETIGRAVAFFRTRQPLDAIGIGSVGPIDPNTESATFGSVTSPPKPAWRSFDFLVAIRKPLRTRVAFASSANAPLFAD